MSRAQSLAYGIRLDGLMVLDLDKDDPALVAKIEARFGPSPVHVKTPRGLHLYYSAGAFVPALKSEGLPVDVKTGQHAYVVAPLSQRPDGGRYAYAKGALGLDRLSPLRAPRGPLVASVAVGERHNQLVKEALAMVEIVTDLPELVANLLAFRDDALPEPESMPDSEVQGIAGWAWKCRLQSRIYAGRNSAVKVSRLALDALRGNSDAIGLYVTLCDVHGHIPGKRFPLVHEAMRAADLTSFSRERFQAARNSLIRESLLALAGTHVAGKRPQTFMLMGLNTMTRLAPNVVSMVPQSLQERSRGRALLKYVDGKPLHDEGPHQ
jgi:Bifunctional DNA primase/polymerase, N-terminal